MSSTVVSWLFGGWSFTASGRDKESDRRPTPAEPSRPEAASAADVLVSRIRSGDQVAFEALLQQHHQDLFAYAAHQLGSSDRAEDVLQDVFFRVWQHRDRLPDAAVLRVYLFRAVRNAMVDLRRSVRWTDRLSDLDAEGLQVIDQSNPVEGVEHQDALRAAEQVVTQLPPRTREAWSLVRERGLTYAEAAAVLGISVGTVHTHVSRAFAAIRAAVAPYLS